MSSQASVIYNRMKQRNSMVTNPFIETNEADDSTFNETDHYLSHFSTLKNSNSDSSTARELSSDLKSNLENVKKIIISASSEESHKILADIKKTALEIETAKNEILKIQKSSFLSAEESRRLEEGRLRERISTISDVALSQMRILQVDLDAARLAMDNSKRNLDVARAEFAEEHDKLRKLKIEEELKQKDSDLEQARFSKQKDYLDLLLSRAKSAEETSEAANAKLVSLLESHRRATETFENYKLQATRGLEQSKNFYKSVKGSTLSKEEINRQKLEIEAYKTETAQVLMQTSKVIETLFEKIALATQRAKEADKIASEKSLEVLKSKEGFEKTEEMLKLSLEITLKSLTDLRQCEIDLEDKRIRVFKLEEEFNAAQLNYKEKSKAKIIKQDEAKNMLRTLQIQGKKRAEASGGFLDDSDDEAESVNLPKEVKGILARASDALKKVGTSSLSKENYEQLVQQVQKDVKESNVISF